MRKLILNLLAVGRLWAALSSSQTLFLLSEYLVVSLFSAYFQMWFLSICEAKLSEADCSRAAPFSSVWQLSCKISRISSAVVVNRNKALKAESLVVSVPVKCFLGGRWGKRLCNSMEREHFFVRCKSAMSRSRGLGVVQFQWPAGISVAV